MAEFEPPDFEPLRLGILGVSPHARAIFEATTRCHRVVVTAVAARDRRLIDQWAGAADDCAQYESYNDLLRDNQIDAVYIGLPTAQHCDWCCAAARMHKHVLVEKPLAANTVEALRMRQTCDEEGVVLMDASAYPHFERTKNMVEEIEDRCAFGKVRRVDATFTYNATTDFLRGSSDQNASRLDPLGCLGDLGWYCVRAGLLAFGADRPPVSAACVVVEENDLGVPVDCTGSCYFDADGQKSLHFHCSYLHPLQQRLAVAGDRKVLTCDDFVVPRFAKDCKFAVESFPPASSSLIDLDTCVIACRNEHRVFNAMPQRLALLEAFADLCLLEQPGRNEYRCHETDSAVYAQALISCLVESSRRGGDRLNIELDASAATLRANARDEARAEPAAKRKRFD